MNDLIDRRKIEAKLREAMEAFESAAPDPAFRHSWALGHMIGFAADMVWKASRPRMVSMDDRCEEAVDIKLPIVPSGTYHKAERQTLDSPGCPEYFEVDRLFLGGFELPAEIANWVEREYGDEIQEQILERRAFLAHEREA